MTDTTDKAQAVREAVIALNKAINEAATDGQLTVELQHQTYKLMGATDRPYVTVRIDKEL